MSNELKITISGPTGSGKSTLAFEIAKVCADYGIECNIGDDEDNNNTWFAGQNKRMQALGENEVVVNVETIATRNGRRTIDPELAEKMKEAGRDLIRESVQRKAEANEIIRSVLKGGEETIEEILDQAKKVGMHMVDLFNETVVIEPEPDPPKKERAVEIIDTIMHAFPSSIRGNWCSGGGPCACMGCVNGSGRVSKEKFNLTQEEHQRWYEWKDEQDPDYFKRIAQQDERTEFDVVLTSFNDRKLGVIKAIRSITGLGLVDSKNLVESTPNLIKEGCPKEEAVEIKYQIEEAGGSVELK